MIGPRVPVEVTTSNNGLETYLSLRLQPRDVRLRLYIEGLTGFKDLFACTRIGDDGFGDDNLADELPAAAVRRDSAVWR